MLRPKVSPPIPHITPKRYVQRSVPGDADLMILIRSGQVRSPTIQGVTIQLKNPPVSQ